MKKKLEDNFPPEEFCLGEGCSHWLYISCMRTNIKVGITDEKRSEERIKAERTKYCEICKATRLMAYQAKSR